MDSPSPAKKSQLGPWLLAVELLRPLLFMAGYGWIAWRWSWLWASPLALATVLSAALVVHDLIHSAHRLPRWLNTLALGAYAQLIIKSGHALRRVHFEHHRICLQEHDVEGGPVRMPVWKLLLTGPWLAMELRIEAWRSGRDRTKQAIETALNLLVCAGLVGFSWVSGQLAPAIYLVCVALVSITVPITGVKLPHLMPTEHRWVRWAAHFVGRLTPAASALLFHELHHRRPRIPVALLADHRELLSATDASNCSEELERNKLGPRQA